MANLNTGTMLITSRSLPQASTDGVEGELRAGRYREAYTLSLVRKQHALADEGSYRVVNNAQTGIVIGSGTAFSNTAATFLIYNNDSPSNPGYKRIHLDYINLCTTVAGTSTATATLIQASLAIDNGNRYTSAGTVLTGNIVNPNGDLNSATVAQVYFGALVIAAPSGAARTVCGLRTIRPLAASTTQPDVVGEIKQLNFGAVEGAMNGSVVASSPNFIPIAMPPVILGPNQCAALSIWCVSGANGTPAQYVPEIGWWER